VLTLSLNSWLFWAVCSAVFAALTAILAKLAVNTIEPDYAAFLRTAVILALLTGYVAAFGKWHNPLRLSPYAAALLVLSGIATAASWVCYFRALKLGNASTIDPIDKSSVLLVAIFAALFLHERLSLSQWGGVILVAAGAALLAFKAESGS
jgi:bacterial/archaeal transporter family protein